MDNVHHRGAEVVPSYHPIQPSLGARGVSLEHVENMENTEKMENMEMFSSFSN